MSVRGLLACVMLTLAITGPALSQPAAATPEQRLARFIAGDINHDGKLDKAEWKSSIPAEAKAKTTDQQLERIWSLVIDIDGSGFVSKTQFLALRMGQNGPFLSAAY